MRFELVKFTHNRGKQFESSIKGVLCCNNSGIEEDGSRMNGRFSNSQLIILRVISWDKNEVISLLSNDIGLRELFSISPSVIISSWKSIYQNLLDMHEILNYLLRLVIRNSYGNLYFLVFLWLVVFELQFPTIFWTKKSAKRFGFCSVDVNQRLILLLHASFVCRSLFVWAFHFVPRGI